MQYTEWQAAASTLESKSDITQRTVERTKGIYTNRLNWHEVNFKHNAKVSPSPSQGQFAEEPPTR